jgi:hypothetical protein
MNVTYTMYNYLSTRVAPHHKNDGVQRQGKPRMEEDERGLFMAG